MKKACKDLLNGDRVIMGDGRVLEVDCITRGMIVGKKMINFISGEWSHAKPNDELIIISQQKES